jgi:hypothetical protein
MHVLLSVMLCSFFLADSPSFTKYETLYLAAPSTALHTEADSSSSLVPQYETIYRHERVMVLTQKGDWLQVITMNGYRGWMLWKVELKPILVNENELRKTTIDAQTALKKANDRAKEWSDDCIMTSLFSSLSGDIDPAGLASEWNYVYWSHKQNQYLIVTVSKGGIKDKPATSLETLGISFDPFAYSHQGWIRPLTMVNKIDTANMMNAAWNHMRPFASQIKNIYASRGPNPLVPASGDSVDGYIPPRGEEMWLVQADLVDGSILFVVLDLNCAWKGNLVRKN